MREIVIDISRFGDIKIDAQGFTGTSCDKATEQLEIVLGGGQAKKTKKPEYYSSNPVGIETKLTF